VLTYLMLAQMVADIALIVLVVLQTKEEGLSSMFGGTDMGIFRTRRGAEKTMFQATIALAVLFLLLSLVAIIVSAG
jgi:preprotein translocase subunit SecG